ncbi:MAG: hypothetical protein RhofKO_25470 [Rhodothermales bacterium]
MDQYTVVIIVSFVGFCALAAILLVPIYRFLKREEQASQSWTAEDLAQQAERREAKKNGLD